MAFGNFGNKYSWLFDHKVRLQICINGQLLLSMLIEKLMMNNILVVDVNTDGLVLSVDNTKLEIVRQIVRDWEYTTGLDMEETKYDKIWFMNTSDYFATYYKGGKIEVKKKGMFLETGLGKGMEFPIISKSIMSYFLEEIPFTDYILNHKEILDFCAYKKFNKDYYCTHGGQKQQRINRYYACKQGAYLYKTKEGTTTMNHVLKDSPVIIYNKFDNLDISQRNINYPFYISKARELIHAIEENKQQLQLF